MIQNFNKIDTYLKYNNLSHYKEKVATLNYWKKNNLISMVRRGVYLPSDLLDKFKIACASVTNGILCYHGALEFYLLQTQEFNTLYVHSTQTFKPFTYQGMQYVYKSLAFIHKPLRIKSKDGFNINVTSLEQTIIDCIYNINLAGGLEELLYALKDVDGNKINERDLLICLKKYNIKSLYQRGGFLISEFQAKWGLSDDFFNYCHSKSAGCVSYLINPYYCNKFDKKWNICFPSDMTCVLKY